ncbi:MAG: hypothetical protein U0168_22405 [Nannocystaceae bacterium]
MVRLPLAPRIGLALAVALAVALVVALGACPGEPPATTTAAPKPATTPGAAGGSWATVSAGLDVEASAAPPPILRWRAPACALRYQWRWTARLPPGTSAFAAVRGELDFVLAPAADHAITLEPIDVTTTGVAYDGEPDPAGIVPSSLVPLSLRSRGGEFAPDHVDAPALPWDGDTRTPPLSLMFPLLGEPAVGRVLRIAGKDALAIERVALPAARAGADTWTDARLHAVVLEDGRLLHAELVARGDGPGDADEQLAAELRLVEACDGPVLPGFDRSPTERVLAAHRALQRALVHRDREQVRRLLVPALFAAHGEAVIDALLRATSRWGPEVLDTPVETIRLADDGTHLRFELTLREGDAARAIDVEIVVTNDATPRVAAVRVHDGPSPLLVVDIAALAGSLSAFAPPVAPDRVLVVEPWVTVHGRVVWVRGGGTLRARARSPQRRRHRAGGPRRRWLGVARAGAAPTRRQPALRRAAAAPRGAVPRSARAYRRDRGRDHRRALARVCGSARAADLAVVRVGRAGLRSPRRDGRGAARDG